MAYLKLVRLRIEEGNLNLICSLPKDNLQSNSFVLILDPPQVLYAVIYRQSPIFFIFVAKVDCDTLPLTRALKIRDLKLSKANYTIRTFSAIIFLCFPVMVFLCVFPSFVVQKKT